LDFHKKRLANFTSGVATINIGGYSQFQIKEKLDRVEDAVRATDCAVKEGYLIGGGISLFKFAKSLHATTRSDKFLQLVEFPVRTLFHTDTFEFEITQSWITDVENSLIHYGVIEPFLVTKTALENAINIATTILSCECAINNNF